MPTFVVGVAFGWVVARTGTLWLPLLGHALHDAVVWALLPGMAGAIHPAAGTPGTGRRAVALLGSAALACAGAALLAGATRHRYVLRSSASTSPRVGA